MATGFPAPALFNIPADGIIPISGTVLKDSTFDVTATSVLVGEVGGFPVTICDVVARRRRNENRTVCCLVHLPVALPQTVALPAASRQLSYFTGSSGAFAGGWVAATALPGVATSSGTDTVLPR